MISLGNKIKLRKPDDFHLHLRDGKVLESVVGYTARVFRRSIIMPNLSPPITTIDAAIQYKERILSAVPDEFLFTPLMTAYLTESLCPELLQTGFEQGIFFGAKLYPANVTTNSNFGVKDLRSIESLFERMERIGMPLLIHGEVRDKDIDIFDRELVFIERELKPLLASFPSLKVVLEHITTEEAVDFVENSEYNLAATITPHHLHLNRNAMFEGGLRSALSSSLF